MIRDLFQVVMPRGGKRVPETRRSVSSIGEEIGPALAVTLGTGKVDKGRYERGS